MIASLVARVLLACPACARDVSPQSGWAVAIMIAAPFAVAGTVGYVAWRFGRAP